MDEQTEKGYQYTYYGRRKTRAINIPTMDEDKKGQSNIPTINEQTDKGNQYTYDGRRQTRAINKPTMDEKTDTGNQYTYDGRIDRQRQSI
jgi:asparagine N-glycosylation enzyme membrane subunit Stt3